MMRTHHHRPTLSSPRLSRQVTNYLKPENDYISLHTHFVSLSQFLITAFWRLFLVWGMSHATTTSAKPSFRAPLRVGDAVGGRGNPGLTTPKSGHPCPCQNCSQWPSAEKTGRESLLSRLSCLPDNPVSQKGLNWTELKRLFQPEARGIQ